MPETVVVVGGGDVAMDACRVAKRLPGCRHVKVIYRRGPGEIPARKIELHHAIKEGDQGGRSRRAIKEDVEFLYHTQQVAVIPRGNLLALECVKTTLGKPDDDGRRRPVAIDGSEHEILCGSVIAAVGQRGICEELDRADMMAPDRVRTEWDSMRTSDPMVFAAGDGAFGGSTIVMAMQHGQRAAYYLRHFLEGNRDPLPLLSAMSWYPLPSKANQDCPSSSISENRSYRDSRSAPVNQDLPGWSRNGASGTCFRPSYAPPPRLPGPAETVCREPPLRPATSPSAVACRLPAPTSSAVRTHPTTSRAHRGDPRSSDARSAPWPTRAAGRFPCPPSRIPSHRVPPPTASAAVGAPVLPVSTQKPSISREQQVLVPSTAAGPGPARWSTRSGSG